MRIKNPQIKAFILDNIEKHSADIVAFTAGNFNISRQTAHGYITDEVKKGTIIGIGQTRATRYFLTDGKYIEFITKITPGLSEDSLMQKYVKPMILQYPKNIRDLCYHGFTEIFNNAIDHSEGSVIFTQIEKKNDYLCISITDNGIGIFQKIQKALTLDSEREAILHLSKGKFTTDPSKHTGEGIFLTSRMCDKFSIFSDDLYYTFEDQEWFLSHEKKESFGAGTSIRMHILLNSKRTPKEIVDRYTNQEIGFHRTIVGVALSASPDDPHVSRSQAKRLMMGLEKFQEVLLDFRGVDSVGPAFIDEIFRVFQREHPQIKIHHFGASKDVEAMINSGLARA